ncbi:hypothetical protein LMG7974_01424 [Campylobacter majalis]|uniref:Uncharacterized protein n=1 Tax=Campylobacter majalis TaxID=2790656 RepID=A0ABM8Q8I5_9BACT|nr:hypothetical protein [Campylobacter majalis]CAD7289263.1 hypothetical protein LMG7974_01424 [Campylobacter majalis]
MDKYEKYVLSFFTSCLSSIVTAIYISEKDTQIITWVFMILCLFGILIIFFVTNQKEKLNEKRTEK